MNVRRTNGLRGEGCFRLPWMFVIAQGQRAVRKRVEAVG